MISEDSIPTGNRRLKIYRGGGAGAQVGAFVVESIDTERPIVRAGEAVLQIPASDSPRPEPGDWFIASDFIPGENTTRRWDILTISQPSTVAGYHRVNAGFRLAHNATD